ncbi:MAG: hypothetical protein EBU90_21740, partial [Proteobacteria bacterium]|nr:hypothetical protein [Pseudomonadota bacterium]
SDAYFRKLDKLKSLEKPHVEALNRDAEKAQREKIHQLLDYPGREEDLRKTAAARDHWNQHVKPIFKTHGLSPKFANAVNKHVAKHGSEEVIKNHGSWGSHPDWFDGKTKKVKKLKVVQHYVVDND